MILYLLTPTYIESFLPLLSHTHSLSPLSFLSPCCLSPSLLPLSLSGLQVRYKEGCKKDHNSSVFSTMPETTETQLAKELTHMQSQVKRES